MARPIVLIPHLFRLANVIKFQKGLFTPPLVAISTLSPCRGNLAATNLLGKPLKGLIVNLADLPWEGVKRLATSGERVNHGSRIKTYKLCRVLKIVITAVLTDTSGPEN